MLLTSGVTFLYAFGVCLTYLCFLAFSLGLLTSTYNISTIYIVVDFELIFKGWNFAGLIVSLTASSVASVVILLERVIVLSTIALSNEIMRSCNATTENAAHEARRSNE